MGAPPWACPEPGDHDFWDPERWLPHQRVRAKSGKLVHMSFEGNWTHQKILGTAVRRCYAERKWMAHVKPRREGSSTFFSGIVTQHAMFREGCQAAIVAHKKETAKKLAAMCIRFHRYTPERLKPYKLPGLKRTLEFPEHDALLNIASIQDDEPLRGDIAHVVIGTEISRWLGQKGEDAWTAVLNAVPEDGGIFFGESTPNFFGDPLHKVFEEGQEPGSKWLTIFIPWTMMGEYSIEPAPGWKPKEVVASYANEHGLTLGQAHWMEKVGLVKCRNKLDIFQAEYPIDEISCFGLAGEPVFNSRALIARLKAQDPTGVLAETREYEVFEEPIAGHRYIVAIDPASSWARIDNYGMVVLDVTTCSQVSEYQGHQEAWKLARFAAKVASKYNRATIYVEANGIGEAVLSHLLAPPVSYPFVYHRTSSRASGRAGSTHTPGFWSSSPSKAAAIGAAQELIDQDAVGIRSRRLIKQLVAYRGQWDRVSRDAQGGHYDLVAAFAIACWAYREEVQQGNVGTHKTPEEIAEERWHKMLEMVADITRENDKGFPTPYGRHLSLWWLPCLLPLTQHLYSWLSVGSVA